MSKLKLWVNYDPVMVNTSTLRAHFGSNPDYEYIEKRVFDHEEAITLASECDYLINTYDQLAKDDLARLAKKTRLIIRYGTGYEKVDVKAATELGIPFANTPGANASPVAELALMHMLNCSRNFIKSYNGVNNRKWPGLFSGTELDGKKIGLMGFGNIARKLVGYLAGFNVDIYAYDPFIGESARTFAADHGITIISTKEELFSLSDIISLHIPVTPETEGCVNKELLSKARKGLILINTCRGKVINEKDLIEALNDGTIRAAGLDVLASEPPLWDNPLLHMENVFITSHTAGSTEEAEMRTQEIIINTIENHRKGTLTENVINRTQIMEASK